MLPNASLISVCMETNWILYTATCCTMLYNAGHCTAYTKDCARPAAVIAAQVATVKTQCLAITFVHLGVTSLLQLPLVMQKQRHR